MQVTRAIPAGFSGRNLVATPARRVAVRRTLRCEAMFGADPMFDTISAISQLATTSALCVGAFMLLNRPEQLPEQVRRLRSLWSCMKAPCNYIERIKVIFDVCTEPKLSAIIAQARRASPVQLEVYRQVSITCIPRKLDIVMM